jgi:predicted transcriptional regulator
MSSTLSIRLDEATERELAELTAAASSRNAAVVEAIHDAYRQLVYAQVRRESAALNDDPADRAEVEAARRDLGGGDAW